LIKTLFPKRQDKTVNDNKAKESTKEVNVCRRERERERERENTPIQRESTPTQRKNEKKREGVRFQAEVSQVLFFVAVLYSIGGSSCYENL
jgi:hypothetical protein